VIAVSWRGSGATAWVAWTLAACSGEADPEPPQRDCRAIVWAQPRLAGDAVRVVGSWDDWAAPGSAMVARGGGWQALALDLPPGEYGYLIVDGGAGRIDLHNPLTTFRDSDGREVSWLSVADCGQPALVFEAPDGVELDGDRLVVRGQFLRGQSGDPLDPTTIELAGGEGLVLESASASEGAFELHGAGLARGRRSFEIVARDRGGRAAAATVSVFVDPVAPAWNDAIVYQVVVDRFRGPVGAWLEPPADPGARAGGTLDGVRAALEDGYFESFGVSALWLSPVYQNPEEPRLGTNGRLYEGYHGYWVEDSRRVDERIGGEQALRELIAAAHARGIAVILDVVPNHVYETHPIVAEQRDAGWFNEHPSECVCGTPSCPWSTHMLDCWFAPYLPDLRLEHPDAMNFAVDELLWWLAEFEVDGLRIDAVPMMPRAASRRIADEVRRASAPGDDRLLLGEVFTGAGPAGVAGLRRYLGPGGLDSVFDFPTMWAIREALASQTAGFTQLDALLNHIDDELAGSGAVLGRMLGNHDVPRFVSVAVGDAGGDAWDAPAQQPEDDLALFERVGLALTLQLTLPGMPVLYYGDELGLAGAGDPDNRRVMPFEGGLSPARAKLLAHARRLAQLRRCLPALRSSARQTFHAGDQTYAYARFAGSGDPALVLLSRADEPRELLIPGGLVPDGTYREALTGVTLELHGATSVTLEPRSAMIVLPKDSPCATN